VHTEAIVACNVRFGTECERYGAAIRAERKAPWRSKGSPLASRGNAAIGVERKPDSIESGVTGHWLEGERAVVRQRLVVATHHPKGSATLPSSRRTTGVAPGYLSPGRIRKHLK
jgi:hypothetical protein